jgi:hypothetical protein
MARANTNDAYNWAKANLTEWFDRQDKIGRKNISVATLDNYMSDLLGRSYNEVWDYFDVFGYIDGVDNCLIIRNDETKQFTVVSRDTLPCDEPTINDWIIEHHGRGHTVFVIISA